MLFRLARAGYLLTERGGDDVARHVCRQLSERLRRIELHLADKSLQLQQVAEPDRHELESASIWPAHLHVAERAPDVDDLLAGWRGVEELLDLATRHLLGRKAVRVAVV